MVWLDSYGWPVEFIRGRRFVNLIRWFLHASIFRSIWWRGRWQRTVDGQGLTDTWCRGAGVSPTTFPSTRLRPRH